MSIAQRIFLEELTGCPTRSYEGEWFAFFDYDLLTSLGSRVIGEGPTPLQAILNSRFFINLFDVELNEPEQVETSGMFSEIAATGAQEVVDFLKILHCCGLKERQPASDGYVTEESVRSVYPQAMKILGWDHSFNEWGLAVYSISKPHPPSVHHNSLMKSPSYERLRNIPTTTLPV